MKSTFSFSVGKIKLYAEITECYNNILYSGIAKLVSRPVWEQGQAGLTPVTQISKTVCSIAE